MTITTPTRTVTVSLRRYTGGWDRGCGPDCLQDLEPDCLQDLEPDFPRTHPDRLPGSDIIVSSDEDLDDMLDFWYTAAYASNHGQDNDGLDGLTEEEIERGDQWILDVVEG